ncbi:MAG: hypothetical protein SFU25_04580 [Candidatus Caenarcaniphilales bacterium]|nr:hypothetical protein [Candidatus Caenarcaniphilales bacterium]
MAENIPAELSEKAKHIKIIALDIDGTLTEGSIFMGPNGEELKVFNVKDGHGLRKAEIHGIKIYLITAREANQAIFQRMEDLKIPRERVFHRVKSKTEAADVILEREKLLLANMAFMGDDEPDLSLLKRVGLSGAPIDACKTLIPEVDFVSRFAGGKGAVREFIDLIIEGKKFDKN